MTTAKWVFDKAMSLADQLSDTGLADYEHNQDLKDRALGILNVLRVECILASSDYASRVGCGKRPLSNEIKSWTSTLDGIDDAVAQGAMPYGLAAQLMLDEDPDVASFCNQKYQEMLAALRATTTTEFECIEFPYGRPDKFNEGSRW